MFLNDISSVIDRFKIKLSSIHNMIYILDIDLDRLLFSFSSDISISLSEQTNTTLNRYAYDMCPMQVSSSVV